jgi:RNA polymerase sigma-70 factor (ECF subfamily)
MLSPEVIASHNADLLWLREALSRLPDEQRTVLELKFLHGLSMAEICERTGRSKPSVVGLLYRGTKTLRQMSVDFNNRDAGDRP